MTDQVLAGAPAAPRRRAVWLPRAAALAIGLALLVAAQRLPGLERGDELALSLVLGAVFGFALQRSRFCFFCAVRELVDERRSDGVLGILAALAVGVVGYAVVFGAWLPDPSTGRLPPTAHIAPVGPALVLAGLAFGAGMSISGSCISAHLYRLGEGSPTAPFALVGAALGFGLGFVTWNGLYLSSIAGAPVPWLPRTFGYGGWVLASLAVLGVVALALLRLDRGRPGDPASGPLSALFVRRWPGWLGGLVVGAVGVVAYLRLAPIGVTAELGARSRQLAAALGIVPDRLHGLDQLRGCATVIRDAILTPNGLFVAGLVLAAFAAALAAGQFKPARPTASQALRGLVGGLAMGWGAMTGLGCTVGTLLSGISAGAVSGLVFTAALLAGLWLTLVAGRKLRILPAA